MEKKRISFTGLRNFRDLGGYPCDGGYTAWRRFFRCDAPTALTDSDAARLAALGVSTFIDLRTDGETAESPFLYGHMFARLTCPLLGDITELPRGADDVAALYFGMTASPATLTPVFRAIADAPGGVVFHCTAGKDRTGVVAAILLLLAGVADEDIIADYQVSTSYLRHFLADAIKRIPAGEPAFILLSLPEFMEGFLARFRDRYGTAEQFLREAGLGDDKIQALRGRLVQKEGDDI